MILILRLKVYVRSSGQASFVYQLQFEWEEKLNNPFVQDLEDISFIKKADLNLKRYSRNARYLSVD